MDKTLDKLAKVKQKLFALNTQILYFYEYNLKLNSTLSCGHVA